MRRAVLSTLGTMTAIVVLLAFKSAPVRVARPPFSSPLNASEPPVSDPPATSPNVNSTAPSSATVSVASGEPTTQPVAPTTNGSATRTPATTATKTATQPKAPAQPKAPSRSAAPTTKAASGTFLGSSAQTRYGPVQIKITYAAGRITGVVAVQLPSGRSRDAEINNYAVPILESETLAAQSANINSVSGATYTSDGYVRSLQSALDAAHR